MKQFLIVFTALVVGGIAGQWLQEQSSKSVRAAQHFTFIDHLDDDKFSFLSAYGSWRGPDLANKINTVKITCDPPTGRCETVQADVFRLASSPLLMLDTGSFTITRLDKETLQAEASPGECIRVILIFDRLAKQVSLVRTKVGKSATCSIVQDEPLTLTLGEPWRE